MPVSVVARFEPRHEPLAYSVRAAAGALGVSQETVRRLVWRGELKSLRLGKRVLIRRADLERLLSDRAS